MIGEPNAVIERTHQQAPRRVEQGAGGLWSWLRIRRVSAMPVLAVGIVLTIIVVAIFADRVAPYDPLEGNYSVVRQPPTAQHLLGTDDIGRDVLSRLIYGARTSLLVGFGSVLVGDLVGLIWGVSSGYIGRRFDLLSQRLLEVVLAFPGLILATMLLLVMGAGVTTVIVAIAVTRVPASTRVIRSVALATKEMVYVDAARVAGATTPRIMIRHIAPACIAPFLVIFSASLGIAITTEAALSFVGVGVPPPAPSWGTMLSGAAVGKFNPLWWLAVFPGLAITITVLAINLAGDSLRDFLDPQLRRRVD
ncbi:MAG TPA: ABC transporter permease [Chloroflexota bacterium]|nr:ABC transporter permease [Chloroflexota bacterium]